jgi:hypothetical protein
MPYADPIARQLYERSRARTERKHVQQREAMRRLRQERKERGEREPSSTPAPIRELQSALSAWR